MKRLAIIGNVGRNADKKVATNGREFMSFSVAVSQRDSTTMWVSVVAPARDGIIPYIVKGRQIYCEGDLEVKMYKNAPEIDLFADVIELVGNKTDVQSSQLNESVTTANSDETQTTNIF